MWSLSRFNEKPVSKMMGSVVVCLRAGELVDFARKWVQRDASMHGMEGFRCLRSRLEGFAAGSRGQHSDVSNFSSKRGNFNGWRCTVHLVKLKEVSFDLSEGFSAPFVFFIV
uniref:Uncharacterized protein n=1 Tax=Trypanosoma congolense (strain IL3000) TaxID=1068625 RepID=G0UTY6_TRYCI|nr:hypothetical protein, unlikely [Trypanosoma congolense IL3000]